MYCLNSWYIYLWYIHSWYIVLWCTIVTPDVLSQDSTHDIFTCDILTLHSQAASSFTFLKTHSQDLDDLSDLSNLSDFSNLSNLSDFSNLSDLSDSPRTFRSPSRGQGDIFTHDILIPVSVSQCLCLTVCVSVSVSQCLCLSVCVSPTDFSSRHVPFSIRHGCANPSHRLDWLGRAGGASHHCGVGHNYNYNYNCLVTSMYCLVYCLGSIV
jgi:hypothetical protein